MKRIKLKNYKNDYICYIEEDGSMQLVMSDDLLYIKELASEGITFYGTTKEKVFENHKDDIEDMITV